MIIHQLRQTHYTFIDPDSLRTEKEVSDCLFCKINAQLIPAKIVYDDDDMLAFYDISPKAEIHFLLIPKQHISSMLELTDEHQTLMGKMMIKANQLAQNLGLSGYKVQVNTGVKGGQEVFHLHMHVLGNK